MEIILHSHQFTEDNVKKNNFSPLTALLLSLSLGLGILVGAPSSLKLLTRVHAQESTCGSVVTGSTVTINSGVINGGIYVRDITVNGELVAQAVIMGSLQIAQGDVVNADGALVGGGSPSPSGALVGGGAPVSNGDSTGAAPCVDSIVVSPFGALVGGGSPSPSGALVGGGAPVSGDGSAQVSVGGATINATGSFVGGELTGDDIVINDGVITGQNLLLSGTTIEGGSIQGTVTSVSISPAN